MPDLPQKWFAAPDEILDNPTSKTKIIDPRISSDEDRLFPIDTSNPDDDIRAMFEEDAVRLLNPDTIQMELSDLVTEDWITGVTELFKKLVKYRIVSEACEHGASNGVLIRCSLPLGEYFTFWEFTIWEPTLFKSIDMELDCAVYPPKPK